MDTAKLFNGFEIHSSVQTSAGVNATAERLNPTGYLLDLAVKVEVPKPATELRQFQALNPQLPTVLPGLGDMLVKPRVSRFYDEFQRIKVTELEQNLVRLDLLLSRHHFYDCETILELEHPVTKRKALLIQAGMDVDTDGSDSDRLPLVDGSSSTFQPVTSYHWAKKTAVPNPFLGMFEAKLASMEAEPSPPQGEVLDLRYAVDQMKRNSFLVAALDPYIVLPGFMLTRGRNAYSPRLGDFCVVIYKDTLYPAIFGDVGPNDKVGEGSLRLSQELEPRANANFRAVGDLRVTYLVFPGTALAPTGPPDLAQWSTRCAELLTDIGGYKGTLHTWEDLTKPSPTPSPTPSVSPSATPLATPSQGQDEEH